MTQASDTRSKVVGYVLWLFGFTGAHRSCCGKPVTGTPWFFTLGLPALGWLIDLFLIPSMDPPGRPPLPRLQAPLFRGLGATDLSRSFRHASDVHGQVAHRHPLAVHPRPAGNRLALRLLDAQRPDHCGECRGLMLPRGRPFPGGRDCHPVCVRVQYMERRQGVTPAIIPRAAPVRFQDRLTVVCNNRASPGSCPMPRHSTLTTPH